MALPSMRSFDSEPLTADQSGFEPCGNPFCNLLMTVRPGKKYCSDQCRMDGYVLRRVKVLLDKVGVVRFHTLLDQA